MTMNFPSEQEFAERIANEVLDGIEFEGKTLREWIKIIAEQEPCKMTAEEYRQRMIQAFRNADCDELVALVVLPTEKEFEHLEWLLEKHYKAKPEPCADCVSRQEVLDDMNIAFHTLAKKRKVTKGEAAMFIDMRNIVENSTSVTPAPKMGRWKRISMDKYVQHAMAYYRCSECGKDIIGRHNYCPNCGAKMEVEDE